MDADLNKPIHPLIDALDVISSNQFTDSQISLYHSLVAGIGNLFAKSDKSLLEVAFRVEEIYRNRFYMIDGYKTIYDFTKSRFSFSRGKTSQYINIVNNFAEWEDNCGKVEPTGRLMKRYEDFSITQLIVMLGMDVVTRKQCKPNMTIRQLKELRREVNDESAAIEAPDVEESEETIEDTSPGSPIHEVVPDQQINDILVLSLSDITLMDAEDLDLLQDAIDRFRDAYPGLKPVFKISIGIE